MSMEGAICLGTNLDDEQTPFTVQWVLHPISGLNNLFFGPKQGKVNLQKHPFCILFQVPPTCAVVTVVINNDEGDHLQSISTLTTPSNALSAPPAYMAHMLG